MHCGGVHRLNRLLNFVPLAVHEIRIDEHCVRGGERDDLLVIR